MKPKYIRVASDLHLEQLLGQREEFLAQTFIPPDPRDAESILVLAGDISSKPPQLIKFLGWLKDRFIKIIFTPGNHEFYGHDMVKWDEDMQLALKNLGLSDQIVCSGNDVKIETFDGLRIIFTTLWADGGKTVKEQAEVGRCLRDFYVVKVGDKRFTVPDMRTLHKAQKASVKELLMQPFAGKTVVATHHMPSLRLCHPRFGTDINGGFASDCEDILAYDHAPNMWLHGHTHDTGDLFMWNTRIVCNPSGYTQEKGSMYTTFGPKFIEIEKMNDPIPVRPAHEPSVQPDLTLSLKPKHG